MLEPLSSMAAHEPMASACRQQLERQDHDALGRSMCANFELRREIFGDNVIGEANLKMVELARMYGGELPAARF